MLMKRILLLLTILSAAIFSARAQGGAAPATTVTGRISGTVIDSLTNLPLDYATATLFRAKGKVPLNGMLTDAKGSFKFNEVVPGNYKVTITYIGYPTKTYDLVVTTPEKPDNNMGTILLAPSASALKEVTVTGRAAIIENKVDKIVYNAERDATVSGGNAGDVLRKVPMVSVDQDGNVSLRGNQNVRILINGKPSGAIAASAADAMKMFPADQIKSVEVITSPSAKYDAEGSGGIINIITKKKDFSGTSGSISGGLGTRQNNGNVNLNIKRNRLGFTGNFGTQYGWPQTSIISNSTVANTGTVISQQNGTSKTQRVALIGSAGVTYDFNAKNSISTNVRLNQIGFSTDGITSNIAPSRTYNQDNETKVRFGGYDWNADYTHKYKKEGHELSVAGQWSHGVNTTEFTALYTSVNPNQQTDNDGLNNEYTTQVDYALPIDSAIKLETGAKGIFRKINSDFNIFRQFSGGGYVFDNLASNEYDYGQDVYAGYAVLTFTLKKGWGMQAGARVENTQIDGRANSVSGGLVPFQNSYTNFVPNISISKALSGATLKLSYNKRIARPSLQYLNPFRNTSNLQYQSMGNPYLSPELSQNVELNLATFSSKTIVNASVYFRHTSDAIESFLRSEAYATTDQAGVPQTISVNLTTFNNIGTSNSLGSSVFGQVTAGKLTLRGNINVFSYQPKANSALTGSTTQDGKTFVMYNAFGSGSLSLAKGLIVETFAIANAPRRTLQGNNPAFNMWVLSVNKEIMNKKGKIGLNVIDPFNERKNFDSRVDNGTFVQSTHFGLPFRSFGVNFSWQFGKLNFDQQPKKKRGVNNDDLKNDGGQSGQTGGE